MKLHIYKKAILAALFTIGLSACESMVDDMNVDPNNPTSAPANLVLTSAQLGNISVQEGHIARVAGMWSSYFTGVDRQYKDINSYNVNGSSFNDVWQFVFQSVVQQTKLVIKNSEATNNRLVQGIAKVIQANALGTATASWGDIPFSQAVDIENYPNPVFEPQADVYEKLQLLLDDAIADLESGVGTSPGVSDIHFSGSTAKWIEVAYTLKARFYLETSQYELAAEATEKGVSMAANSLMAPHGNSLSVNENLMYAFIARSRVGDLNSSAALLPKMLNPASTMYIGNAKTDESARYKYYFLTTNGTTPIPTIPNTSITGVFAQTAAYPLVTYAENLLTAAEAGVRTQNFDAGLEKLNTYRQYLNSGAFLNSLQAGATLKYEAYSSEDFAPGGVLNKDELTAEQALLREVLKERYISFFGQLLGFNDLRRTRGEIVGVQLTPNAGNQLPERFIYSEAEVNSNLNAPSPVPGIFVPTPVNLR